MGALLNIQNIICLLLPPNLTNHIKAGMGHVESVRHVVEGHSLVFVAFVCYHDSHAIINQILTYFNAIPPDSFI